MNISITQKDISPTRVLSSKNQATINDLQTVSNSLLSTFVDDGFLFPHVSQKIFPNNISHEDIKLLYLCHDETFSNDSNIQICITVDNASSVIDDSSMEFLVLPRIKAISITFDPLKELDLSKFYEYFKQNDLQPLYPYRVIFHKNTAKKQSLFKSKINHPYLFEIQFPFCSK